MAGEAGDRLTRLRSLSRPSTAAVLIASLLLAVGAIIGAGRSRAVTLRVGGHPLPASVASPPPPSVPPSTPGSGPAEATRGVLVNAASPVGTGTAAAATGAASPATTHRPYEAGAGRATSADAAPSRPPPQRPASPPPPASPPQPPGLGPRLLPGLPPVVLVPGGGHPSRPPPSSGAARYPSGSAGYDISWPQCGQSYPVQPYTVAIVGVNDGQAFSTNPCLGSEASWAGSGINLYVNINSPIAVDDTDQSGPAGRCTPGDHGCLAYNYGYNAAASSVAMAADQGVGAPTWWLDVETVGRCATQFPTGGTGYWSCDTSLNSRTVQGAIDALRHAGVTAGDYSTSYQWGVVTGGYVPSGAKVPNWIAGADPSQASSWCSGAHDFGGGEPWVIQLATSGRYDRDQAC